jgi:hypothetical protein
MKHRTGKERQERKELKAIGKWPVSKDVMKKQGKIFACEKVLADAPIAVHDLLINYKTARKSKNQIMNEGRMRQPYTKLSDAKTKTKSGMMFPPAKKQEA